MSVSARDVVCSGMLRSTRSDESEDARRDFDGFDIDEELNLFRGACRLGLYREAAEFAANVDEWLCRGGSTPVAWFGAESKRAASFGSRDSRYEHALLREAELDLDARDALRDAYAVVLPKR